MWFRSNGFCNCVKWKRDHEWERDGGRNFDSCKVFVPIRIWLLGALPPRPHRCYALGPCWGTCTVANLGGIVRCPPLARRHKCGFLSPNFRKVDKFAAPIERPKALPPDQGLCPWTRVIGSRSTCSPCLCAHHDLQILAIRHCIWILKSWWIALPNSFLRSAKAIAADSTQAPPEPALQRQASMFSSQYTAT